MGCGIHLLNLGSTAHSGTDYEHGYGNLAANPVRTEADFLAGFVELEEGWQSGSILASAVAAKRRTVEEKLPL